MRRKRKRRKIKRKRSTPNPQLSKLARRLPLRETLLSTLVWMRLVTSHPMKRKLLSQTRRKNVESQLSADSEPEENSSEEEQEKSSSDEEGESSESLSSDDSGFSQVTSKKTRKQQKKKGGQAALALKAQREKELSRSKRSKSRNL
ncbi:hypothetical protein DY000_02032196 [Brassica cretica]|uniref:Uncharacterized protein n=1 Tax=Brassica cretica TaxID=69181 RepID=A0ABQ7DJN6_BRACR|nr:hypothetical protein DY000_02032196 [Brassica cretica]